MEFDELKVFLAVADSRSFTKAAAMTFRTQSAVSQAIRRLEDDLGERLFDRSVKDGQLTEAGSVLADYARQMVRLVDEASGAVRDLRDLKRGRVRVGSNEASMHVLVPIVRRLQEHHPQVLVDVQRMSSKQISGALADGSIDFGMLTFDPKQSDLKYVLLGRDELVLLVPPSHPLAKRRVASERDVAELPIVAHSDPSPARSRVLSYFEGRHEPLDIRVAMSSLDAIKHAVEFGIGVAILPRRCAAGEIETGRLVPLELPHLRMRRELRLTYSAKRDLSRAAAAFLETARGLQSGT
jgi:DNA-binding transcriptional LysR family regulator